VVVLSPGSPELRCLLGRWVYSREEDTERTRTYRPSGWPLPLSRMPRHVLEFEPERRVVSRIGGPADSRIAREGLWDVEPGEPIRLRLEWRNTPQPALIEVITCSEELLQVRVVDGSIE
jgi:hypothetical protein